MLSDDDGRIGVGERRRTGEQVEGGGGQRVLIGAAVDQLALELFRGRVGHRADGHVSAGEIAGLADPSGHPEIDQHHPVVARTAQQDIGRLDIPVQHPAAMGVIERIGHRGHDADHVGGRDSVGVPALEHPAGVDAVDQLHRDPQSGVTVAAVEDGDDIRVVQRRHHLGFLVEPPPELLVVADPGTENFQGIATRQAGMLREVHLAHTPAAEDAHDGVPGEDLTIG